MRHVTIGLGTRVWTVAGEDGDYLKLTRDGQQITMRRDATHPLETVPGISESVGISTESSLPPVSSDSCVPKQSRNPDPVMYLSHAQNPEIFGCRVRPSGVRRWFRTEPNPRMMEETRESRERAEERLSRFPFLKDSMIAE